MSDLSRQFAGMKKSQPGLAVLDIRARNRILIDLAENLRQQQARILRANQLDLKHVLKPELRDRLELNEEKIKNLTVSLRALAAMPDPLRKIIEKRRLKNGLLLKRVAVPLGLVGVIYESRPNVTVEVAALAIKSGNAVILKGGRESYGTNKVLVSCIRESLNKAGLNKHLVTLINPRSSWKKDLLTARGVVDVLIPRGGRGLIDFVRQHAQIPVIETGAGVCHTYIDEYCDFSSAVKIVVNAKTQRPGVCNALDTLVVHEKAASKLLFMLAKDLARFNQGASLRGARMPLDDGRFGVEIFADPESYRILKDHYPEELLHRSKPSDFGREFLSLKMSIKTVRNFQEALSFISLHTSGHSEAILSSDKKHIQTFCDKIDAAVVYANASTRFTDGGQFGMGGEVGISTQKLHVRGPMGSDALTSYKWIVAGNGQVRK